ncbi:hypothetical protein [Tichowtungia aerotolerans]|uniref:Uncharacterized protein n=1 Tax=Tichowtungia aerotolerans TaxID=2697043 RepID=A0A6P1M3J5_9BACT|nr:hypothetical protein [Tichowtungia aerotolerans]QHI68672.1 hypothetical protein GT409_04155 [Tichowtungia aerotolerans]
MIYQPIIANAGVPMIALEMPLMLIALIPVIVVELFVAKRLCGLSWKRITLGVSAANIVSTLIGVPLSWGLMLGLQLLTTGGGGYSGPLAMLVAVTVQAAWLLPYEEHLNWMVPTAMMVLFIPAFLISVWSERLLCQLFWKDTERTVIKRAVWIFNLVSYGILTAGVFIWLMISITSKTN